MNIIAKLITRKRIKRYIKQYLRQIISESTTEHKVEENKVSRCLVFTEEFNGKLLNYSIERKAFFTICKDVKSEEEAKNRIDNFMVQKLYEANIKE